ncbi:MULTISPECIES: glycosyltransferase family 4 protein [Bacillus]|uniref:glycosyltransferase family 4 protein n=1 Tax=Bacillus TaxID=1386 RepID=UPI000BF117DB|nr:MULTISPECIES: glycosyltransferase family 4 protein [Bacillus cereus group]MBJ8044280.1 glycosyltransferase family 4 protein [Bacillus cereus group sp. N17]PEJ00652.1 glycosyl transferase family 1 [Bacillus toyonensis]PFZ67556.1 glycosyl transferase family 1 [Bacillus toyonensis]HDR3908619.1 glycosyltransferase family 4 protein [Bacillus toyonensis]HDR7409227.1 glycosyltransferase family 4 protein [Bacillus toyonensis]
MKKLLILNHFPIVNPPTSGGTIRYFHIYNALSQYYDVTLLSQSLERRGGIFKYSSSFREYKVGSDRLQKKLIHELQVPPINNQYELNLVLNLELSKQPSTYNKYFNELYNTSDIIIHESPYLLGYDRYLGLDNKPRIYNSHNHEYALAKQLWQCDSTKRYLPHLFELEKKLAITAQLVFVTSKNESNNMAIMYNIDAKKIKLAPNGISPNQWRENKKNSSNQHSAFFIGSEYLPNIEAVNFIIQELANKCNHIKFIIAGGCCNSFFHIKKPNLLLLGKVHHKQKLKLFSYADIAINPMFSGAGVNLKTLEYLSSGLPLFSTNIGVRGLDITSNEHFIHVTKENFSQKLNLYSKDKLYMKKIAINGQKYINSNYSWDNIIKGMVEEIEKLE